jgi:hypothetical protein
VEASTTTTKPAIQQSLLGLVHQISDVCHVSEELVASGCQVCNGDAAKINSTSNIPSHSQHVSATISYGIADTKELVCEKKLAKGDGCSNMTKEIHGYWLGGAS